MDVYSIILYTWNIRGLCYFVCRKYLIIFIWCHPFLGWIQSPLKAPWNLSLIHSYTSSSRHGAWAWTQSIGWEAGRKQGTMKRFTSPVGQRVGPGHWHFLKHSPGDLNVQAGLKSTALDPGYRLNLHAQRSGWYSSDGPHPQQHMADAEEKYLCIPTWSRAGTPVNRIQWHSPKTSWQKTRGSEEQNLWSVQGQSWAAFWPRCLVSPRGRGPRSGCMCVGREWPTFQDHWKTHFLVTQPIPTLYPLFGFKLIYLLM